MVLCSCGSSEPIPVAARCKASVCGSLLAGIAGSNTDGYMDVSCGGGFCVGLITRPEESYRVWCVTECDREALTVRRPCRSRGCCAIKKSASSDSWVLLIRDPVRSKALTAVLFRGLKPIVRCLSQWSENMWSMLNVACASLTTLLCWLERRDLWRALEKFVKEMFSTW
jgi:hypothetical protein